MAARQTMRLRCALLLAAAAFGLAGPAAARAATRVYWISADSTVWNVVPSEHDPMDMSMADMPMMNMLYTPAQTTLHTVVYRAYTPGFRSPRRAGGIPGPLIRAAVGDRIVVHFRNNDRYFRRGHTMHFHGVHYAFSSDGSYIPGISGNGGNVPVGATYTYRLEVGADSVGVWPYHDHGPSMTASIDGGLYGAISIRARGARIPDREFVVYFGKMLEFHTIDGRAFLGNTPVFRSFIGDRVQWDVLTLGDEFHTFHIHGHRWIRADGTPEDARTLGPAESFAISFKEDRRGAWLYHCHVETHMETGMIGLYVVTPRP